MFKYLNISIFKCRSGQGLLEIIVAIGVITTGVFGMLTLLTASINGAKELEARAMGANLAKEGIEAVRKIRDSNWLQSKPFDAGLEGLGFDYTGIAYFNPSDNGWTVSFGANAIGDAEAEMLKTADGLMLQFPSDILPPPAEETGYRRILTLNAICEDGSTKTSGLSCASKKIGIEAISDTLWSVGAREHRASFVENIYDWR